jgi:hypothetical protein
MKIKYLLPLLALALSAAKCSEDISDCPMGEPIKLQIGGAVECQGTPIQLVAVKEDSRCPEYTNCVWEGQAVVQLALGNGDRQTLDLTLRDGKPELASKTMGGYIYRLSEVTPYPVAGQSIQPEEYVVTFIVEAI